MTEILEKPAPTSPDSSPRFEVYSDLAILFVIGMAMGFAALLPLNADVWEFATRNAMLLQHRWNLGLGTVAAGLLFLAIMGVLPLLERPAGESTPLIRSRARRWLPLIIAGFFPFLSSPSLARTNPLTSILLLTSCGVLVEFLLRRAWDELESFPLETLGGMATRVESLFGRHWEAFALGAMFLGGSLFFSFHTIRQHLNLETSGAGLGVADNLLRNLGQGMGFVSTPDPGAHGSFLGANATFLAVLLLPFHLFAPRAETLLILQAILVSATVLPLHFLVKKVTGKRWIGLIFAACFLLFPPMQGAVFQGFDFRCLAPFFVFATLLFFEEARYRLFTLFLGLSLLLHEDVAPCLGMFLLLSAPGERDGGKALRAAAACFIYAGVIVFVFMPVFKGGPGISQVKGVFSDLVTGTTAPGSGETLLTFLQNPFFLLNSLVSERKLFFLFNLAGPLLLISFRSWKTALMLLFPGLFCFFSFGPGADLPHSLPQAPIVVTFLFLGALWHLRRWGNSPDNLARVPAATVAILFSVLTSSLVQGAFFDNGNFFAGSHQVRFFSTLQDARNLEDLGRLSALIPKTASVATTESLVPHLSGRRSCSTLGNRFDPADFLLIRVPEAGKEGAGAAVGISLRTGLFGLRELRGQFQLWEQGADPKRNPEGLSVLGISPPVSESIRMKEFERIKAEGSPWDAPGNFCLNGRELELLAEAGCRAEWLTIGADWNDRYLLRFFLEDRPMGFSIVPFGKDGSRGIAHRRIHVPENVRKSGFDALKLVPLEGDGFFSVAFVRLDSISSAP